MLKELLFITTYPTEVARVAEAEAAAKEATAAAKTAPEKMVRPKQENWQRRELTEGGGTSPSPLQTKALEVKPYGFNAGKGTPVTIVTWRSTSLETKSPDDLNAATR